jgi:hypothetical protein
MKTVKAAAIVASVFVFCMATAANSAVIYNVDRAIGAGSINGFIETDGTVGVLNRQHILRWSLTLTSANLRNGPVDTISDSSGSVTIVGTAFTATATDLFFDFDAGSLNIAIFVGNSGNLWCMDAGGCGTLGPGDLMGVNSVGELAEKSSPVGNVIVASTAESGPTVLPEPSTVAFFLIAAGVFARTRKNRAAR